MKRKPRFFGSTLVAFRQLGIVALAAFAMLAVPVASNAQETTSSIQGSVTDEGGNAVGGANLTIQHLPTGRTQSTTTNAAGGYRIAGLRVGGPYVVTLRGSTSYGEERVEDIYVSLGEPYVLNLMTRTEAIDEIIVSSSQQDITYRIGAGTSFDIENIGGMANVNRDFKNIIRQDPRVSLDPTNDDAVSIAGMNNRFNSLTIDGVRQNDDFGLNNSGFPTQRAPISIDAIAQINVEVAPFDVSYGGFTGGTINAVTKSGTNEFDGSIAFYNSNDSLIGDKSEDNNVDLGKFDEDTLAVTLGGPIIKDRLWFFVAYDEFTATDTNALLFGPAGSGRANEIDLVTQQDVDDVIRIADQVYGFNAGALPSSGTDVTDEKLIVKLDAALGDNHDLSLTYQDVQGNRLNPQGSSDSANRLGLASNWYDKSETMESYSVQLFSNWTDRFSTELKVATKEIITGQNSLYGTDFAQMTIATPAGGEIRVGPDIFRHANALTNEQTQIKLKADYLVGDHNISFGIEREDLDVFNLFVFQSEGEWYFDSITDFENRTGDLVGYRNAYTNDENDGAAAFSFSINSFYVQDSIDVTDQMSIQFGVRHDWYSGSDAPDLNPGFVDRNGFANTATLDGRSVTMPRFGFTYDFNDGLRLRGGVGLFSGGNPNVWISNAFSNDGQTIVNPDYNGNIDPACDGVADDPFTNIDAYNLPQSIQDCMYPGAGDVEATDPNFEIPSTWRFNLAAEKEFDFGALGDGWYVTLEAVMSRVQNATEWYDLARTQIDTAPDGRPIYDTPFVYDVLLTNTSEGFANTYSLSVEKAFDTRAGLFDMRLHYTYMDAEDVNPAQSSTVSSNYGRPATFDRNGRQLSTSDFEIKNRFNGSIGWSKNLFGDNLTRISTYFEVRSGKRFSYTMREQPFDTAVWGGDRTFASRDSQLLYVPLLNDPNVIFSNTPGSTTNDAALEASFNNFVQQAGLEGYRGQILPRNFDTTDGRAKIDLRIQQEIGIATLPGVGETAIDLFFDIENLGNMLNNDWGRVEQVFFPHNSIAVPEVSINANGQYVYGPWNGSDFSEAINPASFFELPSLWKAQMGIRIRF